VHGWTGIKTPVLAGTDHFTNRVHSHTDQSVIELNSFIGGPEQFYASVIGCNSICSAQHKISEIEKPPLMNIFLSVRQSFTWRKFQPRTHHQPIWHPRTVLITLNHHHRLPEPNSTMRSKPFQCLLVRPLSTARLRAITPLIASLTTLCRVRAQPQRKAAP